MDEVTRIIRGCEGDRQLVRTPAPLMQRGSTIFLDDSSQVYDKSLLTYGRSGLATHAALRSALADLEGAEDAFLFPSGLSAITGTIQALVSTGEEILLCDSVYGPTRQFVDGTMARFGVGARYFRADASVAEIEALIGANTRLIFLESPGSLTFEVQDIPAIAAMAKSRGIRTAIDNTYAAGVLFKPLAHGIDVSIQSLTKYVCGHSDVLMGSAAASGDVAALLARSGAEVGWYVSPDDAYLALRGLKTLHARLARHGLSALRVARWLESRAEVRRVLCPALPGFGTHDLWKRDFSGACGLLGMVLAPEYGKRVGQFIKGLQLFGLGFSWGGFESLVLPCDPQLVARAHGSDCEGPLLRLHIGLEATEDLIEDLARALSALSDGGSGAGHFCDRHKGDSGLIPEAEAGRHLSI